MLSLSTGGELVVGNRHRLGMFSGVNLRLQLISEGRGGWFSRGDALAAGYTGEQIRRQVRTGAWQRICRDAYVMPRPDPEEEKPWEKTRRIHRLRARIVYHRAGPGTMLSHQTAVVLHDLPDWGLDLSRVHFTKPSGRARPDTLAQRHRCRLADGDTVELDGLRLTVPPRAVVEAACGASYSAAVSMFDACLRRELTSADELVRIAEGLSTWPGSPVARAAAPFADGRSESVGESRLRVLLADLGFPVPQLQVELYDTAGRLVGRVDFLFTDVPVVVEFDGKVKYGGSASDVVVAEKWREDRIRELGYIVVRAGWDDLDRPAQLGVRVARARRIARHQVATGHTVTGRAVAEGVVMTAAPFVVATQGQ